MQELWHLRGVEVSCEDRCESVRSVVYKDVYHRSRQQICQKRAGGQRQILREGSCGIEEALLDMTYLTFEFV